MELNLSMAVLPAMLILDALIGDPVYAAHPIRLLGKLVRVIEDFLFRKGLNQRGGGILLVAILMILVVGFIGGMHFWLWKHWAWVGFIWDVYWGYSLIALRDLVEHVHRIARAIKQNNLEQARYATSMLVGRDTAPMDLPACGRAGIESLAENLVDGVISPLFWFALFGIPGLVAFKIASTLDSMVGFKSERYFYFGWAGARLDDVLNWLPARLTWLLTAFVAFFFPGFSARKAFWVGWRQHARAPGPNSGYSEAAFAGALQMRIAGPIYKHGQLVTTVWLGEDSDAPGATVAQMHRAIFLAILIAFLFVTLIGCLEIIFS